LEFFSWLVNPEQLFQFALQTYDLDLAVMVAEYTQKDPKEYMRFIEEVKRMEDPIQFKVKICEYLKNYKEIISVLA
jgi:elongator complex protein 1